ncbi:MAG: gamma-glutamyltransferase [Proteobacteria bacterium]|nr:gamma-glutamyltransferase [Pseudomonadota bacterium]
MLTIKPYTIATGNYETTKAAAEILDNGGNAFDAILAALFMSFVTEPLLSSPGGGGYLLAHANQHKAKIFDFFSQTPHNKDVSDKDFYPITGNFGATQQEFHIGMSSIATPGMPAGIFAIHNNYGSMPLPEIARSAIKKARAGNKIDNVCAEVIQILTPIINSSKDAKALFTNAHKQLLQQGDIQHNQHLATFLENLSNNSMEWFYFDAPAQSIVNDMRCHNGLLNMQDFSSYQVAIREPLVVEINNWKILLNAKPTVGGYLIMQQLKHAWANKTQNINLKFVEAMIYADTIKSANNFQNSKGTTHMSVIDADQNIASMTVSNGEGSGYVVPHSGFMLNNFLGEEDINTQGFFNFQENTRMASMMSPAILENNSNKIALGTGGSNRIKTALFQTIWQIIAANKTLDQAINLPRFHFENGLLDIEHGFNPQVIEQLTSKCPLVNQWQQRSLYFGGINAVQQGTYNLAIGDSRRNGVGLVKSISISQIPI